MLLVRQNESSLQDRLHGCCSFYDCSSEPSGRHHKGNTTIVDKCLWCDILWSAGCYTNCSSGIFVRQCEMVLLKLHYNHCIKSRSSCSGRTQALVSKQPLRQVSPKPLTYHKLTWNTLDKRTVGAVASLSNSPYE